jgi:hypothetical protein
MVDAVVMWVDGSDPQFRAMKDRYREQSNKATVTDGKGRHRDNGELRYTLRGIEQNLPWIERIFLLTNGQRPNWIDFDSPRIELVTHEDVFPDPAMLPCFNSFAIDSCMHRIPGLSDTFVRFSDDFFVCQPLAQDDMLPAPDSLGRIQLGSRILLAADASSPYDHQLAANAALVFRHYGFYPRHNFLHVPQFRTIRRSEMVIETWRDQFASTRGRRFRDLDDAIMFFLYPFSVLAESPDARIDPTSGRIHHPDVKYPGVSVARQIQAGSTKKPWRELLERVMQSPPTFLNLNDAFGARPDSRDLEFLNMALESLFPQPASFEC